MQPVDAPVPLLRGPPEQVSSWVQVDEAAIALSVGSESDDFDDPVPHAARTRPMTATTVAANRRRRTTDMDPPSTVGKTNSSPLPATAPRGARQSLALREHISLPLPAAAPTLSFAIGDARRIR